ncbi:hypothetical protein NC651_002031 [Populus alba x Populus x berolinensis]|nr:hypothetical protein NC651_002031 [Populus alba x Populus x berolinensis]
MDYTYSRWKTTYMKSINVPQRPSPPATASQQIHAKAKESSFLQSLICLQDPHKQALLVPSLHD